MSGPTQHGWEHAGWQADGWMWNGREWVPEPRPGVVPLRPLGLGDILSGALSTIRRNPGATVGMAALVMSVVEIARGLATYFLLHGVMSAGFSTAADGTTQFDGTVLAREATLDIGVWAVTIIATALLAGMITAAVGPAVLGRRVTGRTVLREGRAMLGRLVATTALTFAVVFAAAVVGVLPGLMVLAVGAAADNHPTLVVGVVLAAVGGLAGLLAGGYFQISLSLAAPIVMLEKQTPVAALRRSRQLVRGAWWRTFGITFLAGFIAGIAAGAIALPFDLAGGITSVFSTDPAHQAEVRALILGGIGTWIGVSLAQPFAAASIALLYVDRRMRTEGLHITLQQSAAEAAASQAQ
jgi:hypothetical protein